MNYKMRLMISNSKLMIKSMRMNIRKKIQKDRYIDMSIMQFKL